MRMRIYRHSILQHKVYSVVTVQTERKMAGLLMKQIHNSEISHRKEAACAVFIRVHSYRNRLACGTLRSLLLDGELQFQGLDQMLLIIEELLDREQVMKPSLDYRYINDRAIEDGWLEHTAEGPTGKPDRTEKLLIQVYGRENRSIQGMMQTGDKRIGFRSGMELVRLIHQYLKYGSEKESGV